MARAKSLLAALVVALAAAAVALADDPIVKINAADQAKATAQLLKKSDVGRLWTGGPRKPDPLHAISCPGFSPKESDLVVTGHADATFSSQNLGAQLDSDVQVMQRASFVRTDFARTMTPKLPGCLAHAFRQSAGQGMKLLSATRLPFPRVGAVSARYRLTTLFTSNGHAFKVLLDFVFVGQSRTEYALTLTGPELAFTVLAGFETRLAKLLVARTRA